MWNCELVNVGPQVPDPVQTGGRGVGDDCDLGVVEALPGRATRIKLEPSRSEVEVIGFGRAPDAVDAMCYPLEESPID
jgi:hypothetical protein